MLQIVNIRYPLDFRFIPEDLMWDPVMRVWLVRDAYVAFYTLSRQLQKDGLAALQIKEAYRSYAYQDKLYRKQQEELHYRRFAKIITLSRTEQVLPAGCSEHQLGTALDFKFTNAIKQQPWLDAHAADYGFVQRYSKEKTQITGRHEDAQHYRFVGVGHAKKMIKMDICLEEYNRFFRKANFM